MPGGFFAAPIGAFPYLYGQGANKLFLAAAPPAGHCITLRVRLGTSAPYFALLADWEIESILISRQQTFSESRCAPFCERQHFKGYLRYHIQGLRECAPCIWQDYLLQSQTLMDNPVPCLNPPQFGQLANVPQSRSAFYSRFSLSQVCIIRDCGQWFSKNLKLSRRIIYQRAQETTWPVSPKLAISPPKF